MAALKVHGQPTAFVTSKRTSAVAWTNPAAPEMAPPRQPDRHRHDDDGSLCHVPGRDVDRLESRSERRATESAAEESSPSGRAGRRLPAERPGAQPAGNPCSSERVHVVVVRARGRDVGEQVERLCDRDCDAGDENDDADADDGAAESGTSGARHGRSPFGAVRVEDGVGHGTTCVVGADCADAEPAPPEAVTIERKRTPASPAAMTYSADVAPGMSRQRSPSWVRCQRNENDSPDAGLQEPVDEVSVTPTWAVPVRAGGTVFRSPTAGVTLEFVKSRSEGVLSELLDVQHPPRHRPRSAGR